MKNSSRRRSYIELAEPWQLLYLPDYVSRFRKIEKRICKNLEKLSFQECMLPKMITDAQYQELQKCMPRFLPEWSAESVTAHTTHRTYIESSALHMCHWQCEPFYFYLRQEMPSKPIRFYDRSGWSYRAEENVDENRLLAFQRIEAVFFVPQQDASATLDALFDAIDRVLRSYGLTTRNVVQEEEMQVTNELLVRDLQVLNDDGEWIEVMGTHLHGRLMIDNLGSELPTNFVTGCCGIGISRIANLVSAAVLEAKGA